MHNWRFLLLAFVAVIQPIASYTERGLVDGRQQRCDYRTASVLRDPGLHFHGSHRFSKPAVEDRRLNQRADVREIRRNEVKEESFRTISSSDRRIVDTLERGDSTSTRIGRASQTEVRFARDGVVLRRESRGSQLGDSRKERNQEVRTERPSNIYANHRARLDSRLSSNRLSEDESRSQFRINNRLSMEHRRDTRGNRDHTQTQGLQETPETRLLSGRARDDITSSSRVDRRTTRERSERMDTKRSGSRLQVNRNANHGILNQRSSYRELTSSSVPSAMVYRSYNNVEATRATRSLDGERRSTQFRQTIDEHTQQRDIRRSRVANNRDSVSADLRSNRQATDRTEKTTNLQSRRTSESQRDVSRRDIGSLGRDQSVENRRESRHVGRNTRRVEDIRFVQNQVTLNSRRDSRTFGRERSIENRRDVRSTRGMERNLRSLEHVAETRKDTLSADRDRVSDNRREIRKITGESRIMMSDRAVINKRDARTFVLDLERSTEVRCTSHENIRDSCSINRERSTVGQLANRDYGRVAMARASSADRSTENNRNTRNLIQNYRIVGLERATDNRRDTRNVEKESRELERNRIAEGNTRTNFRNIRSIEKEQSQASRRDSRNTEYRTARIEDNDRRIARNMLRRALSVERTANHQRDTRENEKDMRNIELNRFSGVRDSRNTHRESRVRAASVESSRRERQYGTIGEERIIAHRRATRSIERDVSAVRGEILSESRKDVRKVDRDSRMFGSDRRERSAEHRREIRNVEKDARTIRTEDSRIIDTARSRDSLSMERRGHRMTERLNMRDTNLDRRNRSVQRVSRADTRRTLERNNGGLERREVESPARNREFLGMTKNPSQEVNEAPIMNWQYIFYILQGLYICGVLTQIMNERSAVKKTRAFSWWSTPQHPIKLD